MMGPALLIVGWMATLGFVATGVIGYRVRSIPLTRVADVSVQASWLDRLLGLTHVEVRDMTGESAGEGVSKGALLLGVDAPGLWAEQILAGSGGALDSGGGQLDEMVGLLRTLVAKAA